MIATFGLSAYNTRLMPWRTVLEVAKGLRTKGHKVVVVSIADKGRQLDEQPRADCISIKRQAITTMRSELHTFLGNWEFDILFIPVSWSHNRTMTGLLHGIHGQRIAYLPGSAFELDQLLPVLGKMPMRQLLPYLTQAAFPTTLLRRALKALDVKAVITNSAYTKRSLERRISLPVVAIRPGRDSVRQLVGDDICDLHADAPFFLFMGPPLPIRGVFVLLDAYLTIADEPNIPPLLCLFRADAHLDLPSIKSSIINRWSHKKLKFVWESLDPEALQLHVEHAIAVVMPFLVVPSEIPLTVYEAAGMGKTIITTGPHGTGDFVSTFGENVRAGSAGELANALRSIARNSEGLDKPINEDALAAFSELYDWQRTAERWEDLAIELGMPRV